MITAINYHSRTLQVRQADATVLAATAAGVYNCVTRHTCMILWGCFYFKFAHLLAKDKTTECWCKYTIIHWHYCRRQHGGVYGEFCVLGQCSIFRRSMCVLYQEMYRSCIFCDGILRYCSRHPLVMTRHECWHLYCNCECVIDFVLCPCSIFCDNVTLIYACIIIIIIIIIILEEEMAWQAVLPTKIQAYKALVLSMLLYAAETWNMCAEDARILESFHMKC